MMLLQLKLSFASCAIQFRQATRSTVATAASVATSPTRSGRSVFLPAAECAVKYATFYGAREIRIASVIKNHKK